jgi:hypothetical protein
LRDVWRQHRRGEAQDGVGLNTIERLDGWKDSGTISEAQHALLRALVLRERMSVFVELNALLYIGVLSLIGGLGWTFRDYVENLGDAAILSILIGLVILAFGYCVARATPYSNGETESPSLIFDYVLYFGCLAFSLTLTFVETRFGLFGGWNTHLLIASLLFGALAYRFDNRFVLSLALSTLAGYLGLTLNMFDAIDTGVLRVSAMLYGAFLLGVGFLLHRAGIKRHFFDVYLQLGANAALMGTASGIFEDGTWPLYLGGLLLLSAASIYLGVRYRRFAFVAYGTLYGYAGLSVRLLSAVGSLTGALFYFAVTGSLVIVALVVVARRFGRGE